MSECHYSILAFDPGSNVVGWCLLINGKLIETGTLSARSEDAFEARRGMLRMDLAELFMCLTCRGARDISLVAVEDPQSAGFVAAKRLCVVKTMIEELAASVGIPYVQVHPSTWQSVARKTMPELRDNKPKVLSLLGAQRRTFRSDLTQDEADAYWIGYAAYIREIGK